MSGSFELWQKVEQKCLGIAICSLEDAVCGGLMSSENSFFDLADRAIAMAKTAADAKQIGPDIPPVQVNGFCSPNYEEEVEEQARKLEQEIRERRRRYNDGNTEPVLLLHGR